MPEILERTTDGWADVDPDTGHALERVADLIATFSTEIPQNVVIHAVAFGPDGTIHKGMIGSPLAIACLATMLADAKQSVSPPATPPAGYL